MCYFSSFVWKYTIWIRDQAALYHNNQTETWVNQVLISKLIDTNLKNYAQSNISKTSITQRLAVKIVKLIKCIKFQ